MLLFRLSTGYDYSHSYCGTDPLGAAKVKTINLLHPPTKGKLMANITVQIGSATLSAGKISLGPFDVDEFAESAEFLLDSTNHLNSGVVITLTYEVTYDGGAKWEFAGQNVRTGGVFFNDSIPETFFRWLFQFDPLRQTKQRQVRLSLDISNG